MIKYKKGGRPILPRSERLRNVIVVRMNDADHSLLKEMAKDSGKSKPEMIRELVRNGEVRQTIPPELIRAARTLDGMANNLNQLARLANTYKSLDGIREKLGQLLEVCIGALSKLDKLLS